MRGQKEGGDSGLTLPLVEEFFSIQGEGYNAGEAAYFIRLGGCDICCSWCDSRFSWDPEQFPPVATEKIVENAVSSGSHTVVVTGGEPLIWNMDPLCDGLKKQNIKTCLETSGAYPLTGQWDWICLSPKRGMPPASKICRKAHELKVVIETADDFQWAQKYRVLVSPHCRLFLQPEWSRFESIIPEIVDYVRRNQEWKISLQIHKYMHIP
ncbi:MAG: 7-carboxy-7-deazaguanine synthase QueE [Bacteroidota bacterium]|nr:7-carboxy-7-deazaguanine synthase QueE [Bacteroidota bacterium]